MIIAGMTIEEMIIEEMIVEEETTVDKIVEMIIIIVEEETIEDLDVMDQKKEEEAFSIAKVVEIITLMGTSLIEMEAVEETDKVTTITTTTTTIIEMDVLLIMGHVEEVIQHLVEETNHNNSKNNQRRLMDSKQEEERLKLLILDQLEIFQETMKNLKILINNQLLNQLNQQRNLGTELQNLLRTRPPILLLN
jgi:hypothetical protein